ncbi:hypothetical protein [Streptomyces sp. NPDC059533]|uniref:hypothetical protein n=1 Tax=unclassified Streptomyces TaxID=2593676 RepID=UPI0036AB072D
MIGAGRKELTPRVVTDFAALLGVDSLKAGSTPSTVSRSCCRQQERSDGRLLLLLEPRSDAVAVREDAGGGVGQLSFGVDQVGQDAAVTLPVQGREAEMPAPLCPPAAAAVFLPKASPGQGGELRVGPRPSWVDRRSLPTKTARALWRSTPRTQSPAGSGQGRPHPQRYYRPL